MTTIINAATSGGLISTADTSGILQLQTASTAAVTINASQNVGIGTASPATKLHLTGGTFRVQDSTGSGGYRLDITSDSSTSALNTLDGTPLVFKTNSTERMRITSTGLVGIGTSSPTVQLLNIAATSVSGPTNNPAGVQLTDLGTSTSSQIVNRAGNTLYNVPSTKAHSFQINSTEAVAMYANGIGLGGAIPSSGTGITFPATQSASSDANTLDDYEEGTWTPIGNGVTLTDNGCSYIKIGRTITLYIDVSWPSTSNTSPANIGGVPFTVSYSGGLAVGYNTGLSGNIWWASSGATSIASFNANNSQMSTSRIIGSLTYSSIN